MGTSQPSSQIGLTVSSVSIHVPGANWIVCHVPFTMCIINVILDPLKATRPTGGLHRPPVMQVIRLPLPVDKTHPFSLDRSGSSVSGSQRAEVYEVFSLLPT